MHGAAGRGFWVYTVRMKPMAKLNKLKKGDNVAILSPSFAAPGKFPHVYELGLKRLREVFGLEPVEFPATKKLGATVINKTAFRHKVALCYYKKI